jgi:hypothetical protein
MRRYVFTDDMQVEAPPALGHDLHKITFLSSHKGIPVYVACGLLSTVDWKILDAAITIDIITGKISIVPRFGSYPPQSVKVGEEIVIRIDPYRPYVCKVQRVITGERNPAGAAVELDFLGSKEALNQFVSVLSEKMRKVK